jgi:hypothetical protein
VAVPFNIDADHHVIYWFVTCFEFVATVLPQLVWQNEDQHTFGKLEYMVYCSKKVEFGKKTKEND